MSLVGTYEMELRISGSQSSLIASTQSAIKGLYTQKQETFQGIISSVSGLDKPGVPLGKAG